MSDYDIVICGAGAGGLTAAILLGGQGRRVLLVDKLTDTVETFKGELLQPGSLATLDSIGALETLRRAGGRRIDRLVCAGDDGAELCAMDYRWLPSAYDHCLTHTYKGILDNLIQALPATVEFRRGVSVERAVRDGSGRVAGVVLRERGARAEVSADLVVAADGHASKLRGQVGIEVDTTPYDHQVVAIDLAGVPELAHQATTTITRDGMRVMYPMPGGGGRLYLQVERGLVNRIGKAGLAGWVDEAVAACPSVAPIAESVRAGVPTCRVLSARRFVAPVFHGAGMPLIGDAAHAVHPMAGQGMNAAIADAVRLAGAFRDVSTAGSGAVDAALAEYNRVRRPELKTISEFSHRFAEMFTTAVGNFGYARSKYILSCHGRNRRLCYKIMHNISGLGYRKFSVLDRLQQLGWPDRAADELPPRRAGVDGAVEATLDPR
ncbi:FAD-dependent monooxygenase [Amycolatopsis sp. Poz14]|uniref:FAD-dependent oxidoreductase n=1 Tax=Amycolatopsis sp. Poz14 TaxID=1447705 RepID=UPI001EE7C989|nr:FAD-dependent monooxygenase [Amycolatopsis sp. Poz14]MCG3754864.1 FAD-dependent monooxygenase [Amycolatopsis sp. Poz14]